MNVVIGVEYVCGIGWMYTRTIDGVFQGRYGNFDTERQALRAGASHRIGGTL